MRLEDYTEKAQEAFQEAQEIMREMHHTQLDVEHIFLAMIRQSKGLTQRALEKAGVDPQEVARLVERELGPTPKAYGTPFGYTTAQVYLTPRTTRLLKRAEQETDRLQDKYVGTEHLLIAIANEREGTSARLLAAFGISAERLVLAITRIRDSQRLGHPDTEVSGSREGITEKAQPLSPKQNEQESFSDAEFTRGQSQQQLLDTGMRRDRPAGEDRLTYDTSARAFAQILSDVNNSGHDLTDAEALTHLITWLKHRIATWPEGDGRRREPYGFDLDHDLIQETLRLAPLDPTAASIVNAQLPFLNAIWSLCIRGILRPGAEAFRAGRSVTDGNHFTLTQYGRQWLQKTSLTETVPVEYGRFSQLLARHDPQFGNAYRTRSQEAVRCYEAHTYVACCAMCGAAAESIMLALAIAKKGDEEAILNDYRSADGRGKIERFLVANQDAHITRNLPNYTSLLNDWRDAAAHGNAPSVGEEEAFTALLLLLRFARFAEERWSDITGSAR